MLTPSPSHVLSVIIPAHDEAAFIGPCLDDLLAQTLDGALWEVIVVANGCSDDTAARAKAYRPRFAAHGVTLTVLDLANGSKPGALDAGDAAAAGDMRAYIDADIRCSPDLLRSLHAALTRPEPTYASGRLVVAPARSAVTRAYARVWSQLPFMTHGVPGAGVFAVNAAGRARWGQFPRPAPGETFVSDDSYVRLLFAPAERVGVSATYLWPMVEGFWPLMRNRRRQNDLLRGLIARYPDLAAHEDTKHLPLSARFALLLRHPFGSVVYLAVGVLAKLTSGRNESYRGRAHATGQAINLQERAHHSETDGDPDNRP